DEKARLVSGGAGEELGFSMLNKSVNGCAPSPGGGLIRERSRRYSGTRTRTLRRKIVLVPAARGSGPATAACRAESCCFTSGGQSCDRRVIFSTADFSEVESPRLAEIRLKSSKAARLSGSTARILSIWRWTSASLFSPPARSISSAKAYL